MYEITGNHYAVGELDTLTSDGVTAGPFGAYQMMSGYRYHAELDVRWNSFENMGGVGVRAMNPLILLE